MRLSWGGCALLLLGAVCAGEPTEPRGSEDTEPRRVRSSCSSAVLSEIRSSVVCSCRRRLLSLLMFGLEKPRASMHARLCRLLSEPIIDQKGKPDECSSGHIRYILD